ncbi:MAG TPA: hypothetical protein VHD35_17490 [Chitinophagaceae bacterium]|nr:hypothetical protein [Chitinophagaceae bacterium]
MLLPLSLKIIAGLTILLLILFFALKRQRKFIGLLIIIAIGIGVWQGLKEYNRTNIDIAHVKADVKISASNLIHEYETNDSLANQKYLGKIIEVDGAIKKLDSDRSGGYVVVLGDTTGLSSVRCAMDSTHNRDAAVLKAGSSAILRGHCSGFNKDDMGLGSDVILDRCALIKK